MNKNIWTTDKAVRIVIAIALVALYLTNMIPGNRAIVALVVAVVLIATSLVGFCGLYTLLGINTCPLKK